jgi:hypothetical protein
VDELSDREAESTLRLLDSRRRGEQADVGAGETEMAALPHGWGETLTGEPVPNVAAAVRRSRETH